jgi:REP element-mobilizing transposase RayT
MDEYESLSHTKWECKYHIVFIPKCRRKTLFGQIRQHLGEVFRKLAAQKESWIEEGHMQPDHVDMLILIPPKYAVSPNCKRSAPSQRHFRMKGARGVSVRRRPRRLRCGHPADFSGRCSGQLRVLQ